MNVPDVFISFNCKHIPTDTAIRYQRNTRRNTRLRKTSGEAIEFESIPTTYPKSKPTKRATSLTPQVVLPPIVDEAEIFRSQLSTLSSVSSADNSRAPSPAIVVAEDVEMTPMLPADGDLKDEMIVESVAVDAPVTTVFKECLNQMNAQEIHQLLYNFNQENRPKVGDAPRVEENVNDAEDEIVQRTKRQRTNAVDDLPQLEMEEKMDTDGANASNTMQMHADADFDTISEDINRLPAAPQPTNTIQTPINATVDETSEGASLEASEDAQGERPEMVAKNTSEEPAEETSKEISEEIVGPVEEPTVTATIGTDAVPELGITSHTVVHPPPPPLATIFALPQQEEDVEIKICEEGVNEDMTQRVTRSQRQTRSSSKQDKTSTATEQLRELRSRKGTKKEDTQVDVAKDAPLPVVLTSTDAVVIADTLMKDADDGEVEAAKPVDHALDMADDDPAANPVVAEPKIQEPAPADANVAPVVPAALEMEDATQHAVTDMERETAPESEGGDNMELEPLPPLMDKLSNSLAAGQKKQLDFGNVKKIVIASKVRPSSIVSEETTKVQDAQVAEDEESKLSRAVIQPKALTESSKKTANPTNPANHNSHSNSFNNEITTDEFVYTDDSILEDGVMKKLFSKFKEDCPHLLDFYLRKKQVTLEFFVEHNIEPKPTTLTSSSQNSYSLPDNLIRRILRSWTLSRTQHDDRHANDDYLVSAKSMEIQEEILDLYGMFAKGLRGKYRILDKRGEGTFSAVYKARDLDHNDMENPWCGCGDQQQQPHPVNQSSNPLPYTTHLRYKRQSVCGLVAIKRIHDFSKLDRIAAEIKFLHMLRYCE
jgi:hypothetical protein